MIKREIHSKVLEAAGKYPAIALLGPRQSGKTTLARFIFADKPYVNLENPSNYQLAKSDPVGFLNNYREGAIFDEIQKVPELLSYLQEIIDESDEKGRFILTGSQNFILHEKISQTLAGRILLFKLLPLSLKELKLAKKDKKTLSEQIFYGFYPRIYKDDLDPSQWLASYLETYVDRDVRSIKSINDLHKFQTLVFLLAGRVGSLVNYNSLSNECGISANTVKSWINILETSFVIHQFQPFYKNFNKRVTKSTKIYFYDTGLLCHLLGLNSADQVGQHYLKGNIFENFVVNEMVKSKFNSGLNKANLFYWRDKNGREIDVVEESANHLIATEIKSSETIKKDHFKHLIYFEKISGQDVDKFLVFAGKEGLNVFDSSLISWRDL